jgi:CRISPR/Cas system-associated exonuclease Cas4 (RecB family)
LILKHGNIDGNEKWDIQKLEIDERYVGKLSICEHKDKEYSDTILLSNPPQHPWTCKKCGYKGVDRKE